MVNDNTIQTKGLGVFPKNIRKASFKAGQKVATNTMEEHWRLDPSRGALQIDAQFSSAPVSNNLKAASSTIPDAIILLHS